MNGIKPAFEKVLADYAVAKSAKPFQHPIAKVLREDFPNLLSASLGIFEKYKITGSSGQGNWAEVPWICIFDKSITESAQEGFYIVYLFHAEMKGVYLSLNQGWTQYENLSETPKEEIQQVSAHFRGLIDTSSYKDKTIRLSNESKRLAKGYELGQICGKFYPKDAIPSDEELIADLKHMLMLYESLKSQVGPLFIQNRLEKTFQLKEDATDQTFQHEIPYVNPIILPAGPIQPGKRRQGSLSNRYQRSAGVAKKCLVEANYRCAVDRNHPTFIAHATKQMYVEAHHLVPIYGQGDFKKASLDVYENILVLCPLCHRKFHHADFSERKPLLKRFYDERLNGLLERGIKLKFDRLVDYYHARALVNEEELN